MEPIGDRTDDLLLAKPLIDPGLFRCLSDVRRVAHGAGAVDGFQEPPGLGGTDLGRLPGQGDLLVRDRGRELLDEAGCVSRGDLAKLKAACVAPLEEADHVPAVGPARVGIAKPRGEKLFRS